MVKKCPPGIICVENYTFLFFGILVLAILFFMYIKYYQNLGLNSDSNSNLYCGCNKQSHLCKCKKNVFNNHNNNGYFNDDLTSILIPKIGNAYSNTENDVLLNPYTAPLRDDRVFNNSNYNGPKIPINVPTQSFDTNYRQIGILTRVNGGETILPLMGRPLFSNRDKWNFYTMNDKNAMIKLPISFKNRSCTSQQGCDNVYNGDTVHVEGFNDIFRVTVYDNNVMQYIPHL
jgi:hypothetical protein